MFNQRYILVVIERKSCLLNKFPFPAFEQPDVCYLTDSDNRYKFYKYLLQLLPEYRNKNQTVLFSLQLFISQA